MKFFSECAGQLLEARPPGEDKTRLVCADCNTVFYDSPRIVVALRLYFESKILRMRRRIEPAKGSWMFPGGFFEKGVTLKDAAVRELREETRIGVDKEKLIPSALASILAMN